MIDTFCRDCHEPIPGEDSANRKPCPKCGSMSRTYSLILHTSVTVTATAQGTRVAFPKSLLDTAASLLQKGEPPSLSMAVVLCHAACDIAADRAFTEALERKSLSRMKESLRELFPGYSPKQGRFWNVYSALTGDDIQQQPFWANVVESSRCRDDIVHKANMATSAQAASAHKAATEFVGHLKQL